jgi:acyl-CoA dehydrogenase
MACRGAAQDALPKGRGVADHALGGPAIPHASANGTITSGGSKMDFEPSERCKDFKARLEQFMDEHVYPAEPTYVEQLRASGNPHHQPAVMEELKVRAREAGLWNMFLPDAALGAGLSNSDYAPLAEILGRSTIASEACNCSAPDTGNMEVLFQFATPEQKERWLMPLLDGEIRSAFAMTEPEVASSDATNIALSIARDDGGYVLNGRKWWISNTYHPHCRVMIVMGKTSTEGPRHRQQSMILVPLDTPGVDVVRNLPVFGYQDHEGHAEITFTDVRVPAENLIAGEGDGFMIAQARLGPGRIHHCMRAIGAAERALEAMCARAVSRETFGAPVATRSNVLDWIAEARIEIEMARLLTLKAAWLMDTVGNKHARTEIAAIKVAAPNVALKVLDRAIQVHGGGGVSDDFGLASAYAHLRTLRLADGPDEVHKLSIARRELAPYMPREPKAAQPSAAGAPSG